MIMQRAESLLTALTRRNDITIALFVVGIIFMMILPMPTPLVDAMITLNMGVAVILLMVAIYMASPLSFSSFPAVLLLTTLFRLALSITTTRLILLQADAGEIVSTFGNFVVAGNLVVGIVVFLIITLVQFIVITKGSERVAEVSARFSLDGMPGKQMSIDGDLRAGAINLQKAKDRRHRLEKEIQLYGAMDGAMKFVKGDAIAGLFIILVNILGGISIGLLQKGMSVAEALQVYAILTVGDGLVAQIPALFIAITAGVIVTRVTTEGSTNLGADIATQIMNQPNAIVIGATLLFGFAFIPGFPAPTFIVFSLVLAGVGYALKATETRNKDKDRWNLAAMEAAGQDSNGYPPKASDDLSQSVPLLLEISPEMTAEIQPEALNSEIAEVRASLALDLGIPFPGINLKFNEQLPPNSYAIQLQEIPIAQGGYLPDHVFVRNHINQLETLNIPYREEANFLPNLPSIWVEEQYAPRIRDAGISFLEPPEMLAYHFALVIRKYASDFIGIQEVRYLLDKMETEFSDLVKEALTTLPIQKLSDVLKRLVDEDISIRNLRSILEAVVEWGQKEKEPILLVELIRSSLKRQITFKYSGEQNVLPAFMLDTHTEKKLRDSIRQTPTGGYLALEPDTVRSFLDNVKQAVGDIAKHAHTPILLTSMDIRHYVRKLIEPELFELAVVSYQELTQDVSVKPLARIGI